VALSLSACGTRLTTASEGAQRLFVRSAEDLKVDAAASTFRLVKVNPQTLHVSDRPLRIAGNLKLADDLRTWKQGRDNFGADPPNATLSVYEPGRAGPAWAVGAVPRAASACVPGTASAGRASPARVGSGGDGRMPWASTLPS